MNDYNPFSEALKALTNEEAQAFYSVRAQADTQAVIDTALSVGIGLCQLCSFVYSLGAAFGEGHYSSVCEHTKSVEPIQTCLPKPRAIAALTPAKIEVNEPVKESVNAIAQTDESLSELRADNFMRLTKKQLIERCVIRGLSPRKSQTKRQLVDMLNSSYAKIQPYQYKSRDGRVVSIA